VLTADAEFRAAANAAFAAWQNAPPYIAYRVDVNVNIKALNKTRTISRAVEARTRDDLAVLQDLPRGQNQLGHAFPVSPAFDAISYFRLDFRLTDPIRQHNPLTAITLLSPGPDLPPQPIRFADVAPSRPDIAVVAISLRNYYAEYAADSGDRIVHIVMHPLTALTKGNDSTYYLKDVYVDTATDLPTRIVYSGPTTEFDLDYAVRDTHWIIMHAYYQESIFAPFHIGQTTFTTDATYSDFTFPAEPKDERLRERPAR
jgi:hypothetical protein